jgi:cysteinyl-tRNA synthetase
MSLRLYNTLTRQKEPFQPIDPSNVRMYVCGPTVYDFAHIGNARPVIVFDVLFRLLRQIYGAEHVTYVRNITDVDDKINARAAERYPELPPEVGIRKLTEETAAQFHKDIAALGVLPPTVEPRATEHIIEMVALCNQLVANGHAYVAADHVLFDVSSMADYGRLSNRSLEDMEAGARVEVAPYKKGPMDFVLWKPSKPGEPAWPSPAGIAAPGRPGWHIECSAMAGKHLGDVFDIHGGGIDLAFPHHENEIAQSRCAHGTEVMARVWMHNGFLQVEGEKMSKSLGNFITIRELLDEGWDGLVLRFFMLKTHYRQPINWTRAGLQKAALELHKFSRFFGAPNSRLEQGDDFLAALHDDLNTPKSIAELHRLANATLGKRADGVIIADAELDQAYARFGNAMDLLGLSAAREFDVNRMFARMHNGPNIDETTVLPLIAARLDARKRKDFKESDRIRDELAAMGVVLKDAKNKDTGEIETTWELAR